MTDDEVAARLKRIGHALQSAIALDMQLDVQQNAGVFDFLRWGKHARTGIDSLFAQTDALARLMIEKGVISRDEYSRALIVAMEGEVERYQNEIEKRLGRKVTFA